MGHGKRKIKQDKNIYQIRAVESVILNIRGQKVILDAELAQIYGVPTKALNQAMKRNRNKFPADFVFQLTPQEAVDVRSQYLAASRSWTDSQCLDHKQVTGNWSQIVTSSRKHRGVSYRPYAFTEHGALMAATVLNSPRAVQMSVFIVRAFIRMRQALLSRHEMEKRLDQIEKVLLLHDNSLRDLYEKIRPLLLPGPEKPLKAVTRFRACHAKPQGRSGVRERHTRYAIRRKRRSKELGT